MIATTKLMDEVMQMPLECALVKLGKQSLYFWEARLMYKLWQIQKVKEIQKMVGL
jgi:hypothetical protein